MFGEFKTVESKIIKTAVNLFVFDGLDFSVDKYQKFKLIFQPTTAVLHYPSLIINDDVGANYDLNTVSMAASYSSTSSVGNNELILGPGFLGGGTEEKLLMDIGVMYNGTSTKIYSKTFTNGSASGDIHYFDGIYTQSGAPTKITFFSDTGVATGLFGVDTVIEHRLLSGI